MKHLKLFLSIIFVSLTGIVSAQTQGFNADSVFLGRTSTSGITLQGNRIWMPNISAFGSASTKFIGFNGNKLITRTAAQVRSDIGAGTGDGTVTSVSGTSARITSTGGTTPVIDISSSYVGQSSITTLGTITAGVWNGGVIPILYGGTGSATKNFVDLTTAQSISGFKSFLSGIKVDSIHSSDSLIIANPVVIGGAFNLPQNRNSDYEQPYMLETVGSGGTKAQFAITQYSDDEGGNSFHTRKARGTQASPTSALAGDRLGSYGMKGYMSNVNLFSNSSAAIIATATENFSSANNGTKLEFGITPNGTNIRQVGLLIDQDGSMYTKKDISVGANLTTHQIILTEGAAGTAGTDSIIVKKSSTNRLYKISPAYYQTTLSGTGYAKFSGSTPSYISAIPNADLANSTISGISLGSNLANLTASNGTLTFSGSYNGSTARGVEINLANPNTWTGQQTFVAPILGTPASGVATNLTGTASGLTAGNVTTNANLTGVITSVGNATSIASQTGTGSKFVVDTSPSLVTPNIGVATGTSLTVSSGLIGAEAALIDPAAMAAGVGGSASFQGKYTTGGLTTTFGQIRAVKENGTSGNFAGRIVLYVVPQATGNLTEALSLSSVGDALVSGRLGINGVADNVKGVTYTPTFASVTNVTSVSAVSASYQRIGNQVFVDVSCTVTPVLVSSMTKFSISLPISSNLGASTDLRGNGVCRAGTGNGVFVEGNSTADTAYAEYFGNGSASQDVVVHFSYTVI